MFNKFVNQLFNYGKVILSFGWGYSRRLLIVNLKESVNE